MAVAKKRKSVPRGATFMSIFGRAEAAIAEQFIREGRATKISKKDIRRAGAPTVNNVGHKVMFAVSVKNADMEEFNARIGAWKLREANFNPSKNIKMFFHCKKCLHELPGGESPESWARLSVGFTIAGLQVWCVRHDCNVCHIDFQGFKHPAILETTQ